jgi:hypothetical protein
MIDRGLAEAIITAALRDYFEDVVSVEPEDAPDLAAAIMRDLREAGL